MKTNWQTIQDDVLTKHGNVAIEQIKKGDEVLGKNEKGVYEFYVVTDIGYFDEKASRNWVIVNENLKFAWHQSIYINGKLRHARELQPGNTLETIDGSILKVETVRKVKDFKPKIKLTIDAKRSWLDKLFGRKKHSAHTFFINGVLVHNASRYWVGGSGTWDASSTTNWSASSGGGNGASAPTSSDDVIIDTNSGFGSGGTLTTNGAECHDFSATSGHSYTIDTVTNGVNIGVYGSLLLEAGITFDADDYYGFDLYSADTGETITTNGLILPTLNIYGSGEFILQDDLEAVSGVLQYSGTLDGNDFNITSGGDGIYIAASGVIITIRMGSGIWEAVGGGGFGIEEDSGGFVNIIPETSTIKLDSTGAPADVYFFIFGGKTFNDILLTGTGTGAFLFYGANKFNSFTVDGVPQTIKFEGRTVTLVSSFVVSGAVGDLITINSLFNLSHSGSFEIDTTEMVTNGGFTGNADNWNLLEGFTYNSNNIISGGGDSKATQLMTFEAGKAYRIALNISGASGTVNVGYGNVSSYNTYEITDSGDVYVDVEVYSANDRLWITTYDDGVIIDNVSVKEILPTQHKLSKTTGVVGSDYLDLSRSNAISREVVDSYQEVNKDADAGIYSPSRRGQSFTGNGGVLNSIRIYAKKVGLPTGNVVIKVYAHSGTFGTNGIPTGAALATSDVIPAQEFYENFDYVDFFFSGENKITLTNATNYVFSVEPSGGDETNYIGIGLDQTSPTHGGNYSADDGEGWNYDASVDLIFYVYKDGTAKWYAGANSEDTLDNDGWIFTAAPRPYNFGAMIG